MANVAIKQKHIWRFQAPDRPTLMPACQRIEHIHAVLWSCSLPAENDVTSRDSEASAGRKRYELRLRRDDGS